MIRYAALAAAVVAMLTGCGVFGKSDRADDRFARPGHPQPSPSGSYTAFAEYGPDENGVQTWVAVIRDNVSGAEVFHGAEAYSSRHGVGITWLSTEDQLWLLSSDVGDAHVDRNPDGIWTTTQITPATIKDIPPEIAALET